MVYFCVRTCVVCAYERNTACERESNIWVRHVCRGAFVLLQMSLVHFAWLLCDVCIPAGVRTYASVYELCMPVALFVHVRASMFELYAFFLLKYL